MPKKELPKSLVEHTPWEKEINPIWPATSFTLRRNLTHFLYPSKISPQEAEQVLHIITNALCKTLDLTNPTLLPAQDLTPLDKEFLYEHFLCRNSFQNALAGQAFLVDDSARFLGLINIQDHLQLQLLDTNNEWDKTYERLCNIETFLGNTLSFAFSPRFGYLTSDPANAGTALLVSIYLHLPALVHLHQLEEILLKQKEEEVDAGSLQGPLDDITGDILVLSNRYTLGLSEENILHTLQSTAMKLMAAEQILYAQLSKESHGELKDQVSRAFGLLNHSYQLQAKETLSALSLLKLGLHLGWITGIDEKKINQIFFQSRRAHLARQLGEKDLDPQKLRHQRASFLQSQLQGIQLKI